MNRKYKKKKNFLKTSKKLKSTLLNVLLLIFCVIINIKLTHSLKVKLKKKKKMTYWNEQKKEKQKDVYQFLERNSNKHTQTTIVTAFQFLSIK